METTAPEQDTVRYAGFWPRLAAGFVDAVVGSILAAPILAAARYSRTLTVILTVVLTVFSTCAFLYLVVRYGGTPGKLLMGLRITLVDGAPVTWRAATLRVSVETFIALMQLILVSYAALQIPSDEYIRLSWIERTRRVGEVTQHRGRYLEYAQGAWGMAELVSLLLNRRRRSVNDLIAGTVVVFGGRGLFRKRRAAAPRTANDA